MKIYRNAKLRQKKGLFDIWVDGEQIVSIRAHEDNTENKENIEEYDVAGRLVSAPYVESHIHLDYVYTANPVNEAESGTLFEAIDKWSDSKSDFTIDYVKDLIYKGIYAEMSNGVQYIRTHIDVTDPNLTALKAMLEVKEEVKDYLYLQIIAFPQEGYYAYEGGDELVEEALKLGADLVGGIPHY